MLGPTVVAEFNFNRALAVKQNLCCQCVLGYFQIRTILGGPDNGPREGYPAKTNRTLLILPFNNGLHCTKKLRDFLCRVVVTHRNADTAFQP